MLNNREAFIKVRNLKKVYGSKANPNIVLNALNFDVTEGEFIGIMGASGSGKTTLLNLLSTIDRATEGDIYYGQDNIAKMNDNEMADFRRKNLGFIFQDFNLLDTLTIEENIMLALSINGENKKEIKSQVDHVIKALGIENVKDKFPYQVSGGQKQRCACARAMVHHPKLVLADEPTGALDSKSSKQLLDALRMMNEELGATIFMVTHDAFSASYCNRILFLKDGMISYELKRENKEQKTFFNEILDNLSFEGSEDTNAV